MISHKLIYYFINFVHILYIIYSDFVIIFSDLHRMPSVVSMKPFIPSFDKNYKILQFTEKGCIIILFFTKIYKIEIYNIIPYCLVIICNNSIN